LNGKCIITNSSASGLCAPDFCVFSAAHSEASGKNNKPRTNIHLTTLEWSGKPSRTTTGYGVKVRNGSCGLW
jgi:hypothetical protein